MVLVAYASKINDSVQLYGIRPGPFRSEPIKERGNQIIFHVNGAQMDSLDPGGRQQLYRYIHLRTADVQTALAAVHKMAAEYKGAKAEEPDQEAIEPISVSQGLYVAEVRLSVDRLKDYRRSEVSIRIYNATGRTLTIERVTGIIRFGDGVIPTMPPPTFAGPTDRRIPPFQELYTSRSIGVTA
jgi:hypothetical protein